MRIVLIGGGGLASDILEAFEAVSAHNGQQNHPIIGIVADTEIDPRRFSHRGVRQIGDISDLKHIDASHYLVAIGRSQARQTMNARVMPFGLAAASVIHPKADIARGVPVGSGAMILSGARVGPVASIGDHVCLGQSCIIGHDCKIEDFATVFPGAVVSGDTVLGEASLIGANATIIEKIKIGERATVGAGAVVLREVPPDTTVVGNPAKMLKR